MLTEKKIHTNIFSILTDEKIYYALTAIKLNEETPPICKKKTAIVHRSKSLI